MLALSEPHKPEIPEALTRLNINYTPAILARTVEADIAADVLQAYDMLLLYTPWDVKTVGRLLTAETMPCIATFGEGTLRYACENGVAVKASAPSPAAPSLVKAVDNYIAAVRSGQQVEAIQFAEDTQKEEFLRTQQSKLTKKCRRRK